MVERRPKFKIGDRVTYGDFFGTVVQIQLPEGSRNKIIYRVKLDESSENLPFESAVLPFYAEELKVVTQRSNLQDALGYDS